MTTTAPTCVNPTACLYNAARRLRYLRAFPFTCSNGQEPTAAECFDYALRVMLDEFMAGGAPEWTHLYRESAAEVSAWEWTRSQRQQEVQ